MAWTWSLARHVELLERSARQTSDRIDRVDDLLDRFSSLELTYAASGFADPGTLRAAIDQLRRVGSENSAILAGTLAAQTQPAAAIAETSAALAHVLGRAQDNLEAGLYVMAADSVFTETADERRSMRGHLRALRTSEIDEMVDARMVDLTQAWAALGGTALLLGWILVRRARGASVSSSVTPATPVEPEASQHDVATAAPAASAVDLAAAAALCSDIGRLAAGADVQGLLERTARLLNAPGVVLWMGAGEELFPAAAHGYDLSQLNRLGPISRSAVNATAAAWRLGRLQTVPAGNHGARAAVVAPLLGPERCVGVLAVEIDATRETDAAVQAVTTLIAAQFAAVLTAWPAGSTAPTPAEVLPFDRAARASS